MSSINWQIFQELSCFCPELGFGLDVSGTGLSKQALTEYRAMVDVALNEMSELESGAIANCDEDRMVGHYWLRSPDLSPTDSIADDIRSMQQSVSAFAEKVLRGEVVAATGKQFRNFLLIGIGGSALGPQLLADALPKKEPGLGFYSLDNTDPEGIERELAKIPDFSETLIIVISKSGGTKETRNAMLLVEEYCRLQQVPFAQHAIAVTGEGSALMKIAHEQKWCATFPMWDWVGGRTSICSAVGLLPLALLGHDIAPFLDGAAQMDAVTRAREISKNPAMLLALAWYKIGDGGRGTRDMVVLPYKDSLIYFSRYLQQLVMESLGKEHDRSGAVVNQGIAVYGNKGSTDQHAYVQQLRDGIDNFFVTFIEVLQDTACPSELAGFQVEDHTTAGDYLAGFLHGTRQALAEKGRKSLTLSISTVDLSHLGMLIALFERAVGFYASFVNINAYHQPGVEAGKKAAASVLEIQKSIVSHLQSLASPVTALGIAEALQIEDVPLVFRLLQRLAANGDIQVESAPGIYEVKYGIA